MREIKFRAWYKYGKKMVDLYKITPLAVADHNGTLDGLFLPFDNNMILMQFTGLKDKNGKEIYEGDVVILRCHVSAGYYEDRYDIDMDFTGGVVILPSMGACIKNPIWVDNMDDRHGKNQGYKNIRGYRSEVIGNIYENPELISPKTDSTPNRI